MMLPTLMTLLPILIPIPAQLKHIGSRNFQPVWSLWTSRLFNKWVGTNRAHFRLSTLNILRSQASDSLYVCFKINADIIQVISEKKAPSFYDFYNS